MKHNVDHRDAAIPPWSEALDRLAEQLDGVPTELRAAFVAKLCTGVLADYGSLCDEELDRRLEDEQRYHESGGRDPIDVPESDAGKGADPVNFPSLAGVEAWQLGRARDRADLINHPSHYTAGGVEAIAVIEAWQLGFALGNALKYIARAGRKGDRLEDLRKARWYLEREIANEEAKRDVKP